MRISLIRFLACAALVSTVALTSCDTGEITGDEDTVSSQENDFADSEFSRMSSHFDIQARLDPDLSGKTGKSVFCPNADVTGTKTGTNTYSLTIDFGTGCDCADGRTRAGKLSGTLSGKWPLPGTTLEITPTNYSVTALNGTTYSVAFDRTVTINPVNAAGNFSYTDVTTNGVFASAAKGTFSWEGTHTVEWIKGDETLLDPTDNEYSITGQAQGSASNDITYTAEIATPLIVKYGCAYITSGVLEVTPDGLSTRSLDYGTGTCDNKATFSVGGFSSVITLR